MRAVVLESGSIQLRDIPKPSVRTESGEALVRVRLAGICRTDLELAKGYMEFRGVLGHEFCGEVVEHPEPAWVGCRVAGEINLACGNCSFCKAHIERHCPHRQVLGILGKDGCFAEYVSLPTRNLHRIPDDLADERACFIEPLAAAFEIVEQIPQLSDSHRVRGSDGARTEVPRLALSGGSPRVAVLGDGRLGQLVARVIALHDCDLWLFGHHDSKLARARAQGIAVAAPEAAEDSSFDVVVEATGSASGMQRALRLVRPRGILVLKSTYHGLLSLDAAPLVIDEITLIGSRCGPFEPAIEALRSGAVDPTDLIEACFPLDLADAAFARAEQSGTLKVLFDMRP